jgi:hypothetical protein
MLKISLLFIGLLTLVFIVWHVGPGRIYDVTAQLGPMALLAMLIPSIIMYAVEAYGWKVTLAHRRSIFRSGVCWRFGPPVKS